MGCHHAVLANLKGAFLQKSYVLAGIISAFVVLPGCASITSSEMQTLTLTTATEAGATVAAANCVLKNDKGEWQAVSPAQVAVRRSPEDLMVTCKKEGAADGFLRAVSRAAGGMFGNIVFGGGIGALVDHNTGKGYNYPDDLPVKMGGSVTVDRKTQNAAESPGSETPR
jgi:hypothetical protein